MYFKLKFDLKTHEGCREYEEQYLAIAMYIHIMQILAKKKKKVQHRGLSKKSLECDTGNFIPLAETITNLLTVQRNIYTENKD